MAVHDMPTIEVITVEPTPAEKAEAEATAIQAMSEGVEKPEGRHFEFMGKTFRLADKVGLMPLMRFAHMASNGMDTDDDFMGAMAAIYDMIRDVIHADQWAAFQAHAVETKANEEQLLGVVQQAVEIMTARPTEPGSVSSPSAQPSTPSSTDVLSQRRAAMGLVPVAELAG
jgi:hypothetical protein